MYKPYFALFILLLLMTKRSSGQINRVFENKKCCCGIEINTKDILTDRIPYGWAYIQLDLTSECRAKLRALINQYEEEDYRNWKQITNQACSYREGWVEKVPGTCQAGGPPPICPEDHWLKEPQEAMNIWNRLQKNVLKKRLSEMKRIGCECVAEQADALFSKESRKEATVEDVPTSANPYSGSSILLPCTNGECPPGYACEKGICQPKTIATKVKETPVAGDIAKAINDEAVLNLLDKVNPILHKLFKGIFSTELSVVTGIFESTTLSTWSGSYSATAHNLSNLLEQYQLLVKEHKRIVATYPNCSPCRDLTQVKIDVANLKTKLQKNFNNLNIYYAGIIDEHEACSNCCEQVFVVYHKWFCRYYLQIANYTF